jgi:hypothetical protein
LEGLGGLGCVVRSSSLTLLTSDVVVVLRIVVICLVLIVVYLDTEIIIAVKPEIVIIGLPKVSNCITMKLYAYIVSCLSSVLDVGVVVVTANTFICVVQAVLRIDRVKRLVACKGMLARDAVMTTTKILTIEDDTLIGHVVDCSGGYGCDIYGYGTVKWDTVICLRRAVSF